MQTQVIIQTLHSGQHMEHFLLPRGARSTPDDERAPYLAEEYDRGPFLEFPGRSRYDHIYQIIMPNGEAAFSPRIKSIALPELKQVLQTWLYFGLLHEVFGYHAPADTFVVHGTGGRRITSTINLGNVVESWSAEMIRLQDEGGRATKLEHLMKCIQMSYDVLFQVHNCNGLKGVFDHTPLFQSIAALSETLEEVVTETLAPKGVVRTLPTRWELLYSRKRLPETVKANGWCPTEPKKWLSSSGSFQALAYMSKMQQPRTKDHGPCTGDVCLAKQHGTLPGRALHRCAFQNCDQVGIDEQKMMSILEDGHIGLLDIRSDTLGGLSIEVVSSKDHSEYVALSHVWADGLGNPQANSLPRCQLSYVASVLQRNDTHAESRTLVWLDTLCCPVNSPRHRNICLIRMGEIYQKASKVLILDSQLATYNSSDLDSVELCARLISSAWMRRLWCLQEGALAQNLWIQLKDRAVDLDTVEHDLSHIFKTQLMHVPLITTLIGTLRSLRILINRNRGRYVPGLYGLVGLLQGRCVTVASDEALCLCACLDLDQGRVVRANADERMIEFWLAMRAAGRDVPSSIIFFHGKRLTNPGFGWSPATLLEPLVFETLSMPKSENKLANIGEEGLLVRFSGMETVPIAAVGHDSILDAIVGDFPVTMVVRERADAWYMLSAATVGNVELDSDQLEYLMNTPEHMTFIQRGSIEVGKAGGFIAGSIKREVEGINYFHAEVNVAMVRMDRTMSNALELLMYKAKDSQLGRCLATAGVGETPLLPNEDFLSKLPNELVSRMLSLTAGIVHEPRLSHYLSRSNPKDLGVRLAEWLLVFLLGRCREMVRSWPETQQWCVD